MNGVKTLLLSVPPRALFVECTVIDDTSERWLFEEFGTLLLLLLLLLLPIHFRVRRQVVGTSCANARGEIGRRGRRRTGK